MTCVVEWLRKWTVESRRTPDPAIASNLRYIMCTTNPHRCPKQVRRSAINCTRDATEAVLSKCAHGKLMIRLALESAL
jgi:hypothetical protein